MVVILEFMCLMILKLDATTHEGNYRKQTKNNNFSLYGQKYYSKKYHL